MALLSEFGIVLALKAATVRREALQRLEGLPGWANTAVGDSLSELHHLDERVALYDRYPAQMAREDSRAQQLVRLSGIGETTATVIWVALAPRRLEEPRREVGICLVDRVQSTRARCVRYWVSGKTLVP